MRRPRFIIRLTAAILVLIGVVLSLEAGGFLASRYCPDLFDHRDRIGFPIETASLSRFVATRFSSSRGWDSPATAVDTITNCHGERKEYAFDAQRFRIHRAEDARSPAIIIAGDSFTLGAEVDAGESYPALVDEALGVRVINAGVSGYGPLQALMKLAETARRFPGARIAVLAIMYENPYRLLNSYRPVWVPMGFNYGFKPSIDGAGRFVPLAVDAAIMSDGDKVRAAASLAFDTDFYRKPRATFPYGPALLAAMGGDAFQKDVLIGAARLLGRPTNDLAFRLPAYRAAMAAVFTRFSDLATEAGMVPVVLMIPRDRDDTASGRLIMAMAEGPARDRLRFVDVGAASFDWRRYSLGIHSDGSGACHPSPEGQRLIAATLVTAVRPIIEGR